MADALCERKKHAARRKRDCFAVLDARGVRLLNILIDHIQEYTIY